MEDVDVTAINQKGDQKDDQLKDFKDLLAEFEGTPENQNNNNDMLSQSLINPALNKRNSLVR